MANNAEPQQEGLTDLIMVGLKRRFQRYGHRPSAAHWKGLRAIAETVEAMASGNAEPKFYLSSLPTGMGKTTTLVESVRALVSSPNYAGVGAVLFVNQLDQIPKLIEDMELTDEQYSVRTGVANSQLNALGRDDHANAQVLFTTQQKLPHLLSYRKNFSEMPFFKFQGAPRRVRIWDEAILPIQPLALTAKHFEEAALTLDKIMQQGASTRLREWTAKELPLYPSNALIEMPLLVLELQWDALGKLEHEDDLVRNVLWMSGHDVRLYKDDWSGATTITYRESLPSEFAPLLVLDASGSLRLTYELWDEKVLFIIRKQEDLSQPNVALRITARVCETGHDPTRLHFLTWGKHTATNEYADVKHVIVVGALQYTYAQNEAMGRGAGAVPTDKNMRTEDVERVRLGEIAHRLFQAVGRGAVRKSVEGDCPPGCNLWFAASSQGKAPIPPELLQTIFPGARLEKWLPVEPPLKKNEASVVKAVQGYLRDRKEVTVSLGDLGVRAGCSWNTVLRKLEEQRVADELRRREVEAGKPDRRSPKGAVRISRLGSLQLPIKGPNKNLK